MNDLLLCIEILCLYINYILSRINRISTDLHVWHNQSGDHPLTVQGSARPPRMEPARTRGKRSSGCSDRAPARGRHKRAAPSDTPSDLSRIRDGRRRVHRRERRRPWGAAKEAAPKKELGFSAFLPTAEISHHNRGLAVRRALEFAGSNSSMRTAGDPECGSKSGSRREERSRNLRYEPNFGRQEALTHSSPQVPPEGLLPRIVVRG